MKNYPILRLLLPYILGILCAYFGHFLIQKPLFLLLLASSILLISCVLFLKLPATSQGCASVGLWLVAFLMGVFFTNARFRPQISDCQKNSLKNDHYFVIRVEEPPVEKAKSVKIVANLLQDSAGTVLPYRAVFYLQKDKRALALQNGDQLLVHTELSPIEPPKNPHTFNNQLFLQRKGIYYSHYLSKEAWCFLSHQQVALVRATAHRLQRYFSELFARDGLVGDEYAVITAILLGNDDTMDSDLKSSYSAAGVSHILCVSGMHVGIIYMILNFLLMPLERAPHLHYLKTVLLLLAIWFYAHLTGLAPSVKRAATMFTFVAVGNVLRRPVTVYHSLFASMFILLLTNPLLIFEIGFEMSYLAVFGIVMFQNLLVSLYHPKTKVVNYFWELMTVSVSAQLATFPLAIYYFGQFPNYFLLANMSVIALSFGIVVTGVALLAISWWPVVAHVIGWLLTREIRLLNAIVRGVESLPGAVSDHLSLNFVQVLLIYMLILCIYLFWKQRQVFWRHSFLALGVLLLATFCLKKYQSFHTQQFTIYALEKMSAIGFRDGRNAVLLLDSAAQASPFGYAFQIEGDARYEHIDYQFIDLNTSHFSTSHFVKESDFIRVQGKTIFLLSGRQWFYPGGNVPQVDYVVLRNNPKIPFSKLKQIIDFKKVIIDGSNSRYWETRWNDSCKVNQVPCYSLRKEGYLRERKEF